MSEEQETSKADQEKPQGWHQFRSPSTPNTLTLRLFVGELQLIVVENHPNHPGKWMASCWPYFEAEELLEVENAEQATKAAAIRLMIAFEEYDEMLKEYL